MTSHSEFGEMTDGKEVASAFAKEIKQKTILITGVGPNGLGAILSQTLAAHGPALLILTGRSVEKVEIVAKNIASTSPNVATRVLQLDLASLESVREATKEVNAYSEPSIDILINNAGVMNIPERTLTTDGFEAHLAVNYLGAFLFTNRIMGKLTHGGGARIVNVSSNGYMFSPFRFADYNFDGKPIPESETPPKHLCEAYGVPWSLGYSPTIAYGQSKTALLLYSTQLGKLLCRKGVTTVSIHPGAIATDIWRHIPKETQEQLFTLMPMKTPSQGVSTALVAALDPKLTGSSAMYLENCQPQQSSAFTTDPELAEKLWKLSEKLVGQSFQID